MPDSTRPKSSMFFQVVKNYLTDGALRRIISNPGGKNYSIIFAYLTSRVYELLFNRPNQHGKVGQKIFEESDDWLSSVDFLKKMKWGGSDEPSPFSINMINKLFISFVQDKAMKSRNKDEILQFKHIKTLDYPSEDQIIIAKNSNKFFMQVIDDLTDLTHKSLEAGEPAHDRTKSSVGPLWEAFLADPLVKSFEDEMVYQVKSNLPKKKNKETLNVVQFGTGTGNGTIALIGDVIDLYQNIAINIYCVEESPILIRRAREQLTLYKSENHNLLREKNLDLNFEYMSQQFSQDVEIPKGTVDIIMCFQCMQWLSLDQRNEFFARLSKLIHENGSVILAQSSSYSKEFPYPLTLMYFNINGFSNFPTKDEIKTITATYFKSIKSSALDAMWVLEKPHN